MDESLGIRPSQGLVKESRKAIARIESELVWKIEAIAALPNPPGMDILLCQAAKARMEAEEKRLAETKKAQHRSVILLEELYQTYDAIVSRSASAVEDESEDPAISKAEANLDGKMKLNPEELLQDLKGLILFNVPDSSQKLSAIAKLDLSNNNIKSLPESVTSLVNLRILDVHSNQLTSLPQSMGRLANLKVINISGNFFTDLPQSVQNCGSLEELIADFNKLQRLPESLGFKLLNLQKLSVHSNKLCDLPFSISHMTCLRVLDVHMNKLRYLPEDIEDLVSLQILDVSCNFDNFKALPDSICGLTALVALDVSFNQIKTLPYFIGGLTELKRLNLEGNPLILPPPEIVRDGLKAVMNYMTNRATQSLLPPSLSCLGAKQQHRLVGCTGGTRRRRNFQWFPSTPQRTPRHDKHK